MSKPFKVTSPTSPGVGRDPSTGQMISLGNLPSPAGLPREAPPQVVRESSDRGVDVLDVIKTGRSAYAGGSNAPYPELPKPTLPFKITAGK